MPCFCVFFFLHLIVSSWHRVKAHLFLARFNLFSVNVIHEQQTTTGCCCCDCCCTTQQKSTDATKTHKRNYSKVKALMMKRWICKTTTISTKQSVLSFVSKTKRWKEKPACFIEMTTLKMTTATKTIITIITMTNWYCNISVNECGCLWPRKARVRIQRAVNTIAWIDQVNKFKGSVSIQNNKLKWWQRNEERKGEKKRTPKRCHTWSTLANNSIKMYFHLLYV